MYYSKYNLLLPLKDDMYPYALMNPLSGAFDLATAEDKRTLDELALGKQAGDPTFLAYLQTRGYLFSKRTEESSLVEAKLLEFQAALRESAPQVLLIPTYSCNLACVYCFQQGIKTHELMSQDVVDAFFGILAELYPFAKPFITLFGGEPLINSPSQRSLIDSIVKRSASLGYEVAAVTNGFDLLDYLEILTQAKIKEIQVTIDGPESLHDARRHTANGKGTYARIMAGLRETINRGIPVNLRVVADKTNFPGLVDFAKEIEGEGWLDLPPERFKTQIGRNYELFECYASPSHLMDQVEHWAKVVELSAQHPVLKKFHQPEFKGIKYLVQTGEMYLPSFDTCPACKTEWVFDLYGNIYGCTANAGRQEYKLGSFYPSKEFELDQIQQWQSRNVLNIPECRDCEVSLLCGGGCGVVANQKNGRILSPDCRPIKELLTLGINHYKEELLSLGQPK